MSRRLTRIAVLGVLLCSAVFAGWRGASVAHASPVSPQGVPAQVSGGSEVLHVPCHVRTGVVDTCTITHTWQAVTTMKGSVGRGATSTGPDLVCCGGGGNCTTGSTNTVNTDSAVTGPIVNWTIKMWWNFNWNNCTTGAGAQSITTTYYDYACSQGFGTTCGPITNVGVSLFSCPGTPSCNGLAHADFAGTYAAGGSWSDFARTTGNLQGVFTMPNTVNP